MILQPGQKVESLQAVNAQCLEEIVVRRELFARHLEVGSCQGQDFVQGLVRGSHGFSLDRLTHWIAGLRIWFQGKYGCASVLSTNFRRPASTPGCAKSSQKMSISCF